jgi:hypothetical protein
VTAPLPSTKSLSGTTVGSITEIKNTHVPLGMWKNVEIPNMGHYASWAITMEQGNESFVGVPSSALKFFKQNVSPNVTDSVGSKNNSSENRRIESPEPSKYGDTLVWWNNDTSTPEPKATPNRRIESPEPSKYGDTLVWWNNDTSTP